MAPWCSQFPNFWNLFDTFVQGRPSNSNFSKCPWQLVDTWRNSNLKGFLANFWFKHFTAYPSCWNITVFPKAPCLHGSVSSSCTGRLLQGLLGELSWKRGLQRWGGHDFRGDVSEVGSNSKMLIWSESAVDHPTLYNNSFDQSIYSLLIHASWKHIVLNVSWDLWLVEPPWSFHGMGCKRDSTDGTVNVHVNILYIYIHVLSCSMFVIS